MKLDNHIKLHAIDTKKLLVAVLSLQIALWAMVALRALGVSIPIVQPLIGFVYLTFVPGLLVLAALRLRDLDIIEIVLYAVGLSIAVVLSIGLVASIVFNALNVIKPFSLLAITSSVSVVVLLLCYITYFRNRTHRGPLFTSEMSVPLAPTLFLCILPLLAVFTTYLVSAYNVDAGQLFLWLLLGIVALFVAFETVIPSKLYPLAVFVIALTLLFQETLTSAWLSGSDVQLEWSLAHDVLNTGVWNSNLLVQYNGMLSVVALAPIYSLLSNLDLIWIFKLVYPVLCALVPVGLYQIFRRQLNDKVAFLSCFFFVSFTAFFELMIELARQEVAELLYVLLILLIVSNEMNQRIRSALFIVFGLSLVVSHYGLFYIGVFFLFMMWFILTITRVGRPKLPPAYLRTKTGPHKHKQLAASSPKSPPTSIVTIVTLSMLFIASTAWYFYTAQGTITQQVISLAGHIAGSIGQLFSPTYSQAVHVVKEGPLSGILHRVNAYVNYLNLLFIVVGLCVAVFLKKQRFKLEFPYVALSLVAFGFLLASIAVPFLAASLNYVRVYQITLIILAPLLAIGFIKIGETANVIIQKVSRKLQLGNLELMSFPRLTRLLALYMVLFMLLSTGFLFAIAEGYENIALSNQVDGRYNHQTIVGATWQTYNSGTIPLSNKSVTIFHYVNNVRYNDTTQITNAKGQISFTRIFESNGPLAYFATFDGAPSYDASTSAIVIVNVGGTQSIQPSTSFGGVAITSVAQTNTTLSASTTIPRVGQPVTFTATLTTGEIVYADYYNKIILSALGLGQQAQIPGYPETALSATSTIFLGTYNIEHKEALVLRFEGVNADVFYTNVTPYLNNRSLVYSNGGASIYS